MKKKQANTTLKNQKQENIPSKKHTIKSIVFCFIACIPNKAKTNDQPKCIIFLYSSTFHFNRRQTL